MSDSICTFRVKKLGLKETKLLAQGLIKMRHKNDIAKITTKACMVRGPLFENI